MRVVSLFSFVSFFDKVKLLKLNGAYDKMILIDKFVSIREIGEFYEQRN